MNVAETHDLKGAVSVERYGRRNWAVLLGGRLLCVTVYRKGAVAVRDVIARFQAAS